MIHIHLINTITVALAAALLAVTIEETAAATARNSIRFVLILILSIALLVCIMLGKLSPVNLKDIYLIYCGQPGSILNLAHKCMIGKRDFWTIRDYIFWGQRTCILTSEASVSKVLANGSVFERVKAPGDSITSPHSILGAGGVSNTWKRLRGICGPFFNRGDFEEAHERLVDHINVSVNHALANSTKGGVDLFQLVNRLVVEAHLLAILGVDYVEEEGKEIPVRDFIDSDKISSKCMADIIDESLVVKLAEPKFSSAQFAPMMTWLTDRLGLPADQLGGIEKILAEAQRMGDVSSMERLHNCVMYMIALAPSPASFWTLVHVYKDLEWLKKIREESDDGKFLSLAMCVKETLRMYAPVPIMVTRYFRKDKKSNNKRNSTVLRRGNMNMVTTLTGHDHMQSEVFKDGDRLIIPTLIIHNDPSLWKDPNEYDPTRFDAPENMSCVGKGATAILRRGSGVQPRPKAKPSTHLKSKARYFPFGQGKHTCVGQPYAAWLTMTITSTILNNYDMEIEDVEGLLNKECSYERIKDHVYTFPKAPFKATITALKDDADDDEVAPLPTTKASRRRESFMSIRKENLRKSMGLNMQRFSNFFQENDDDDELNASGMSNGFARKSPLGTAVVEEGDDSLD